MVRINIIIVIMIEFFIILGLSVGNDGGESLVFIFFIIGMLNLGFNFLKYDIIVL